MTALTDLNALRLIAPEIELSLAAATSTLATFNDAASVAQCEREFSRLRGAFNFANAPGLACFVEALSAGFKACAASPASQGHWIELLGRAPSALRRCVKDSVRVGSVNALKLFPVYTEMKRALGEDKVSASDLFYPNLEATRELKVTPVTDADARAIARQSRARYQRGMLAWLKGDANGLLEMARSARALDQVFARDTHFWWIAVAFLEAVRADGVKHDSQLKRVCARVDLQIRRLIEGGNLLSDALMRELLYFVGMSSVETPRVAEIRTAFALKVITLTHDESADASATRDPILLLIRGVQHACAKRESGATTVESRLHEAVADLVRGVEGFGVQLVHDAIAALQEEFESFSDASQHALERFVQLLLALEQYFDDDVTSMAEAAATLAALVKGNTALSTAQIGIAPEFTREIQKCLRQVETIVEALEAKSTEYEASAVAKPLRQAAAALLVGGHLDAERILRHAEQLINAAIVDGTWSERISDIADCLGALDFYIDSLRLGDRQGQEILAPTWRKVGLIAANDIFPEPTAAPDKTPATIEDAIDVERRGVQTLLNNRQQDNALAVDQIKNNLETIHQDSLIVADQQMSERSAHALSLLQGAAADIGPHLKRVVEAVGSRFAEPEEVVAEFVDIANDPEVLEFFVEEAREVAAALNDRIASCRHDARDSESFRDIRRLFHTLKGSSGVVGLSHLAKVAWAVERQLNAWLDQGVTPTSTLLDAVTDTVTAFSGWVVNLETTGSTAVDVEKYTARFAQLALNAALIPLTAVPPMVSAPAQTEMVSASTPASVSPSSESPRENTGVSHTLFGIFLTEARQRLETLRADYAALCQEDGFRASSVRAMHTLAGIAGTVKIEAVAELAAAGEHWLMSRIDAGAAVLKPKDVGLLRELIDTLDTMLTAVEASLTPAPSPGLCSRLEGAGKTTVFKEDTVSTTISRELPVILETAMLRSVAQDILPIFLEEAHELGAAIARELLAWREAPNDLQRPEAVARYLHTLKGSARAAGAFEVGDFAHATESRVQALMMGDGHDEVWINETQHWFDNWLGTIDQIRADAGTGAGVEAANVIEETPQAPTSAGQLKVAAAWVERLLESAGEMGLVRARAATEVSAVNRGVLDLKDGIVRMGQYLREIEIQAESQMSARLTLLDEANASFDPLEFDRFTRLQELTRLMAESLHDINAVQQNLLRNLSEVKVALDRQELLNRDAHSDLMRVYAVPFSNLTERLTRVVRQTAQALGKQAELRIHGSQVELDRSLLDRIVAPFEHLLRNAIAHGIEEPESRERAGKDEVGCIEIFLHQESNRIRIEVVDDGAGLDLKRIRRKAEEAGLIDEQSDLNDAKLSALIFAPGLTTADSITEIAGRGIGMDAVRNSVTSLGGNIEVHSVRGRGTRFTLYLPLTVVVVSVLSVVAGGRAIAVPSNIVRQVQRMNGTQLRALYELKHAEWQGESYAFHYLGQLLGDAASPLVAERNNIVLLIGDGQRRVAIHVDSLSVNQDVTLKDMGPQLGRINSLKGATVTGSGRVLLVVDPLALQARASIKLRATDQVRTAAQDNPLVLIVDDSMTVRKVTSRLMERAGYRVAVAKDGVEGLELVQAMLPAVILLDIEMPRMDGFEFTRHLRADLATCKLPIIMISSRTAEKHRVHAEQLGVNLFLGKPFQDDQLLGAVAGFTQPLSLPLTGT